MTIDDLLNIIQKGGWTGYVALVFGFAGALLRGTIRSKREVVDQLVERDKKYDEMKTDRDYWKTQALGLTEALERLTDVFESTHNRPGGRR